MSRRWLGAVLALALAAPVAGQQIVTFTHTQGGGSNRPIGYPVPLPVASLDPVDGFRDYASIEARLQGLSLGSDDLAAHAVGTTQQYGRTLWAYRASDPDTLDWEGGAEPAFFINGGIHAREWGTPEIATWLLERMVAGAGDGGIVRYLLDNTALVVVPVHNVDGFLQTQRYPTRAIVGSDPTSPGDWPRDGRMRRKNMRGVDELLETFADHLGGVDLNRNHPPYWATDPGYSSANPASLVYHGNGAHSERESQAMVQALLLAPPERLRMAVDVHSFTQVFYSSNTGRARLNAIQSALLSRVAAHHRIVSRSPGGFDGAIYTEIRDPPGRGGGLAAEYFAHEFLVPAWTLEIEPSGALGGRQYGGTGESHSGFILPAAEVRRVREAWAESHIVGFYFMAGAPYLAELRIVDGATGASVARQRWERSGAQRQRVVEADGALQPGRRYRAELVFSKPMRVSVDGAAPSGFPGQGVVPAPALAWLGAGQEIALDTASGSWSAQGRRYAYDTFVLEFDAPPVPATYVLRVDTRDAVGHRLDANPATPVEWVAGAWAGLEQFDGSPADEGGPDATTEVLVQSPDVVIDAFPSVLGEGDTARLVVRRQGGSGALSVRIVAPDWLSCPGAPALVEWDAGETAARTLALCATEDLDAQGQRSATVVVESSQDGQAFGAIASGTLVVLDNDAADLAVVRAPAGSLRSALALAGDAGRPLELVLDRGEHALPAAAGLPCHQNTLSGPVTVHGNGALLRHEAGAADCALLAAVGSGPVTLNDLTLSARRAGDGATSGRLLQATVPVTLRRVVLESGPASGNAATMLVASEALTMERVALRSLGGTTGPAVLLGDGASISSSSFATLAAGALLQLQPGSSAAIEGSTLLATREGGNALRLEQGSAVQVGSSLLQHTGAGALCAGAGARTSTGGNVASDTSCATGAGDRAPVLVPLASVDEPTGAPLPGGAAVDAGGSCPLVDLRGAPRPQSTTAGATALCDAGAIELGTNPYRGLWIPDRPGHGLDIHTVGNVLFLTWYTYHPDGSPAAYQASGTFTGPLWRAPLLSAQRLDDGRVEVFEVGEIELDFASDTAATLRWRLAGGAWGEEGLSAYFFASGEPRFETTGTWYDPSDPGWGLTVTRRGGITGVVLYYYDGSGTLRWALGQGGDGDVLELALSGFTGFCPDCDAAASPPQAVAAGTLRLQFLTPRRAIAWVDAGSGSAARFARAAAALTPINDPVDNRRAAAQEPSAGAGL